MSQELLSRCVLIAIAMVCLLASAYIDYKRDKTDKQDKRPKDAEREAERHSRINKEK